MAWQVWLSVASARPPTKSFPPPEAVQASRWSSESPVCSEHSGLLSFASCVALARLPNLWRTRMGEIGSQSAQKIGGKEIRAVVRMSAQGPKKTLAGRWTQRADGFRSTPVRSTPPDGPFGRKPTLTRAPDVERPDFTADQRRDRDDPGCLLERCGLVPLIGREALRADRLPFPSQGSPLPRSDRRTGRSGSPNTRRCRSRDRSSSTG